MTGTTRISFWLMPDERDGRWLGAIIDRLAQKHEAPNFAPHVTIFSGEFSADVDIDAALASVVENIQAVDLRTKGIEHSAEFTMTLFVRIDYAPVLGTLRKRVAALSLDGRHDELTPHLSLLYGALSADERSSCAATVSLESPVIRFDDVRAVETPGGTSSREDVELWKTLGRISLPG